MIVDLRDLDSFPAHVFLTSGAGDIVPDYEGIHAVKQVDCNLDIQKSGDEYYCRGDITATVNLECARCLAAFDAVVKSKIDFIICSESGYKTRVREALDDEDYVFFQGVELTADISEIVRQMIILAVGMKPLCSEDCKGLCPRCGVNLNEETCSCQRTRIDPRWHGLEKLRNG